MLITLLKADLDKPKSAFLLLGISRIRVAFPQH